MFDISKPCIRAIFGSQNFGYNIDKSDIDHIEFYFPTFRDLIFKHEYNRSERKESNGTITKVYDIRHIKHMVHKGNISDLQVLYSQSFDYKDDWFNWFILNRDRLMVVNPYNSYASNFGMVREIYNKSIEDKKHLVRGLAIGQIILQIVKYLNGDIGTIRFCDRTLAYKREKCSLDSLQNEFKRSYESVRALEEYFNRYKGYCDDQLILEIEDLVCTKLYNLYKGYAGDI